MLANPGKVVTRFQFSFLFGHAWMKAMTHLNIVAGFKVTGVYPTDRYRILPKSPSKPPTICEQTGIKFIPLFTALRQSIQSSEHTLAPLTPLYSD